MQSPNLYSFNIYNKTYKRTVEFRCETQYTVLLWQFAFVILYSEANIHARILTGTCGKGLEHVLYNVWFQCLSNIDMFSHLTW